MPLKLLEKIAGIKTPKFLKPIAGEYLFQREETIYNAASQPSGDLKLEPTAPEERQPIRFEPVTDIKTDFGLLDIFKAGIVKPDPMLLNKEITKERERIESLPILGQIAETLKAPIERVTPQLKQRVWSTVRFLFEPDDVKRQPTEFDIPENTFLGKIDRKIDDWLEDNISRPVSDFAKQMISELDEEEQKIAAPLFDENPKLSNWKEYVYVVESGLISIAEAVGIFLLTKSPDAAAGVLSWLESSDEYNQARRAGESTETARKTAVASGVGTFFLEKLGMDFLFKNVGGSWVVRGLKSGAMETLQEEAQTVWQNVVAKYGYDDARGIFDGWWETIVGTFLPSAGVGIVMPSISYDPKNAVVEDVVADHSVRDVSAMAKMNGETVIANKISNVDVPANPTISIIEGSINAALTSAEQKVAAPWIANRITQLEFMATKPADFPGVIKEVSNTAGVDTDTASKAISQITNTAINLRKQFEDEARYKEYPFTPKQEELQARAIAIADDVTRGAMTEEEGKKLLEKLRVEFEDETLYKEMSARELTTTILQELEGKTNVSKQFVQDLTRMTGIKQAEITLIENVLNEYPEGEKIPAAEFAEKVQIQLLPLESNEGVAKSDTGEQVSGFAPLWQGNRLTHEFTKDVDTYQERIYQSPIKNQAGDIHFERLEEDTRDNYFAHTRSENMKVPRNIRRILEIQSDLFQRKRLKEEIGKRVTEADYFDKAGIETPETKARLAELRRLDIYRNTWWQRIVREEIRQAALDRIKRLRFPTGETAMQIEGLAGRNIWFTRPGGVNNVDVENLGVGLSIYDPNGNEWKVTKVYPADEFGEPSRDFKAIMVETIMEQFDVGDTNSAIDLIMANLRTVKDAPMSTEIMSFEEALTLADKGTADTSHPIYKFYENDIQKFLKKVHPEMERITDKQGMDWWEIRITKADLGPVIAFKHGLPAELQVNISEEEMNKRLREIFDEDEVKFMAKERVSTKEGLPVLGAYGNELISVVKRNGKVSDYVTYHEAFHAYLDLFVTSSERADILKHFTERWNSQPGLMDSDKIYWNRMAEEIMADSFAEYLTKKRTLSQKIRLFFIKILNKIKSWIGKEDVMIATFEDVLAKKRPAKAIKERGPPKFKEEPSEEQRKLFEEMAKEEAKAEAKNEIDEIVAGRRKMRVPKYEKTDWLDALGGDRAAYMRLFKDDPNLSPPDEVADEFGMTLDEFREAIADRIRIREAEKAISPPEFARLGKQVIRKLKEFRTISDELKKQITPFFRPARKRKSRVFSLLGNKDTTIPLFANVFKKWVKSGVDTIVEPYGGAFTLGIHSIPDAIKAGLKEFHSNVFDIEKYNVVKAIQEGKVKEVKRLVGESVGIINDVIMRYASTEPEVRGVFEDFFAQYPNSYIGSKQWLSYVRELDIGKEVLVYRDKYESFRKVFQDAFDDIYKRQVDDLESAVLNATLRRVGKFGEKAQSLIGANGFMVFEGKVFDKYGMIHGMDDMNELFKLAKKHKTKIVIHNEDGAKFTKRFSQHDPAKLAYFMDPPYIHEAISVYGKVAPGGKAALDKFTSGQKFYDSHKDAFDMTNKGARIALTNDIDGPYLEIMMDAMKAKLKPKDINYKKIAEATPDSDAPPEISYFKKVGDKIVYVEGWCDRCFGNVIDEIGKDRGALVKYAKGRTQRIAESQPNLPQNKNLKGYELLDYKFVETPGKDLVYGVSIGVYGIKTGAKLFAYKELNTPTSLVVSAETEALVNDFLKETEKVTVGEREEIARVKEIKAEKGLSNMTIARIRKAIGIKELKNATPEKLDRLLGILEELEYGDKTLTDLQKIGLKDLIKNYGDFDKKIDLLTQREVKQMIGEDTDILQGRVSGRVTAEIWPTVDIKEDHPIIARTVDRADTHLRAANKEIKRRSKQINEMMTAAEKSEKVKKKDINRKIFEVMSGKKGVELTAPQRAVVIYLRNFFKKAKKDLALKKYRHYYIPHIDRTLMEKISEGGILGTLKSYMKPRETDIPIEILLAMDHIIGSEKFFRFALERTGGLKPTMQIRKIVDEYSRVFETKKALDTILPEAQAAQQLLLKDKSQLWMQRFLQNLKGRALDSKFRMGTSGWVAKTFDRAVDFNYIRLLALNYRSALKNIVGGESNSFVYQSLMNYLKGKQRLITRPKTAIKFIADSGVLDGSYADLARSTLIKKAKRITDIVLYGGMEIGEYEIRGSYLLGELTKEEWDNVIKGKKEPLTPERFRKILDSIAITQGIYTKTDSPLFAQTWMGRALLQFGRWKITNLFLARRIAKQAAREIKAKNYTGPGTKRMLKLVFLNGLALYLMAAAAKRGNEEARKYAKAAAELIGVIYDLVSGKAIYEAITNNPTISILGDYVYTFETFASSLGLAEKPYPIKIKRTLDEIYISALRLFGIQKTKSEKKKEGEGRKKWELGKPKETKAETETRKKWKLK